VIEIRIMIQLGTLCHFVHTDMPLFVWNVECSKQANRTQTQQLQIWRDELDVIIQNKRKSLLNQ
jgi:hypothetical protein